MPFQVKKIKGIDKSSLEKLGDSVVDLAKYTEDEFSQIASALQGTEADPILYVVPPKPRRGTQVYADGAHWNPGVGEGFYEYTGSLWVPMFVSAGSVGPLLPGLLPGALPGALPAALPAALAPFVPGYLFGLTLSTAGGSSTFGIAAGIATNSTATDLMKLASAYTKTTAAWAVGSGNGALDTGAIANSTWYHVYEIKRPDTGVVDILISLSATAPTLPANYTIFRRIGSMSTDASAHWIAFTQNGDEFLWVSPINGVFGDTTLTGTPKAYTLSVPTGVVVNALVYCYAENTGSSALFLFYPIATSLTPSVGTNFSAYWQFNTALGAVNVVSLPYNIRTNTSGQIEAASSIASGNTVWLTTAGWIDTRGKLS